MMTRMELVCPAGTPATLRAAVQAGADAVYCGFRDETNARNFPGLNFSREELAEGVRFAHGHGSKVLVAINTFARVDAGEIEDASPAAELARYALAAIAAAQQARSKPKLERLLRMILRGLGSRSDSQSASR